MIKIYAERRFREDRSSTTRVKISILKALILTLLVLTCTARQIRNIRSTPENRVVRGNGTHDSTPLELHYT